MSRYDLLVFGASGFTGKYTIKELIKIYKTYKTPKFTWGVAGRNKEKLFKVLVEMCKDEKIRAEDVPIVIADLNDENSLAEMAKQAKVIINCCGPYRFYGEAVVKACIENRTHHVDVSGEPQYMEKMQLTYHEKAKEKGVYVVSACGFDSIPADLGIIFLKNEFDGEVNSVEIFLDSWTEGKKSFSNSFSSKHPLQMPAAGETSGKKRKYATGKIKKGSSVHYGTWESAIYGLAHYNELRPLRKELFTKSLPSLTPKLQMRFPIFKSELVNGKWCLPFPGSDRSVIRRSQYFFYEHDKERPIQCNTYVAFNNFFITIAVIMVAAVFAVLARFEFGRKLLLKYPKLFSGGFADHDGPPEKEAEKSYFSMTFNGVGWKEKLAEPTDQHTEPPNKKIITKVVGRNPGYGSTCIFLIVSALMCLEEEEKMPDKGGVYPPAAAFAKTSMIKRLKDYGIKFDVICKD